MHCVAEVQINTVAPQNDTALELQTQTRGPRWAVREPYLGKPPATSTLLGTCLKQGKNWKTERGEIAARPLLGEYDSVTPVGMPVMGCGS